MWGELKVQIRNNINLVNELKHDNRKDDVVRK